MDTRIPINLRRNQKSCEGHTHTCIQINLRRNQRSFEGQTRRRRGGEADAWACSAAVSL